MPNAPRENLVARLHQDLIGPDSDRETLEFKPSDVYLTGILWPHEERIGPDEDERLGAAGGASMDASGDTGDAIEEEVRLTGMRRPSAAGISFAASLENGRARLVAAVSFATYRPETGEREGRGLTIWHREPFRQDIDVELQSTTNRSVPLDAYGAPQGVKLHLRAVPWGDALLGTVTLLNDVRPDRSGGRVEVERLTLFQTELRLKPVGQTELIGRPSRRSVADPEDAVGALLYRQAHEFAVGHTCSAGWADPSEGRCPEVFTTWLPTAMVKAVSSRGHRLFAEAYDDHAARFGAYQLAQGTAESVGATLAEIADIYAAWIQGERDRKPAEPLELSQTAEANLRVCEAVLERMRKGAQAITADSTMLDAFRLANLAMHTQHSWDREKAAGGALVWRPFQLGFMLLAAESVVKGNHPDRRVMDLLWFPTGGGKTEAYLALVAFLAFHRRMSNPGDPDAGAGVAAIMRYTLRLLTQQQFVRASALMMACEAIRRGRVQSNVDRKRLGAAPFGIGLWIGGEATPNNYEVAAASLGGAPDEPSPKQLTACPCCGHRLVWQANVQASSIEVRCRAEGCKLHDDSIPLPIYTVDSDVYAARPTLLIGTIDKFAQVVRQKRTTGLLGGSGGARPDLIIQDELHLISGPLGTVAGLYEAALDLILSRGQTPPKIIGSTATIRRAADQVTALFDRELCQFPPPALDASESGFASVDEAAPGRLYAAVTTAGRSAKFTLQAVAASLLQSGLGAFQNDATRDPYWTAVTYFNSLRELGGALVLLQDDVNDTLSTLAKRRKESPRKPNLIEELTSRRTQDEIRDMLDRMAERAGGAGALDVVLATNMLSVGVDIPRLGLMLVNGQPKGIAEYIQATSRVGRGNIAGLVVSTLNNAKTRDRSHFESFTTWHSFLYRDVEATSVTPFASRARDRALHAVLVAVARHLVPGLLDSPQLDDSAIEATRRLIDMLVERAKRVDPAEPDVKKELLRRLDSWERRAPTLYWNNRQPRTSLLQDAERAAMLRAMGRAAGEAWPTSNNMRSIEPNTRYRLVAHLRGGGAPISVPSDAGTGGADDGE